MTNEERFEQWWATQNIKMTNHILTLAWEEIARAAWNAALSDEDRKTIIMGLDFVSDDLLHDDERAALAAVRRRLEGR